MGIVRKWLILFKLLIIPAFAEEINPAHNMCGRYIEQVSIETNVPPEVLWAVARAESNIPRFGPWPWSLNIAGKSYYFKNHAEMLKFLSKKVKNKTHQVSIDIGCMQLNSFYHGHKFSNIFEMTDIYKNMLVAGQYLRHLFEMKKHSSKKKLSDNLLWGYAVGDYHSQTNRRGAKYIAGAAKFLMTHPSWHDGVIHEPNWHE